jgi:hypothetical protein
MGYGEPLVQWSLQGKKSPNQQFFDVCCAKRNKFPGQKSVLKQAGSASA